MNSINQINDECIKKKKETYLSFFYTINKNLLNSNSFNNNSFNNNSFNNSLNYLENTSSSFYENIIYYTVEIDNFDDNELDKIKEEIDKIIKNIFYKDNNTVVINNSSYINNNNINKDNKIIKQDIELSNKNFININNKIDITNRISFLNYIDGYNQIKEWGTLFRIETPWSSNLKSIINTIFENNNIFQKINVKVTLSRIEKYIRTNNEEYFKNKYDSITQTNKNADFLNHYFLNINDYEYINENISIDDGLQIIKLEELEIFNDKNHLGFDKQDIDWLKTLYEKTGRNLNKVEIYDLAQSNSEHSRHWFFKGKLIIDNDNNNEEEYPYTLFQLIKKPLENNNKNSVIAFCDDASCIEGFNDIIERYIDLDTNKISYIKWKKVYPTLTAETHNFPTGVAPFEGANTGVGGRIRDTLAIGKGGDIVAGIAGYSVGNLNIPGYNLEWENEIVNLDKLLHVPYNILIEASNGASDYGNKLGEPIICGFTRTFGETITKYIHPVNYYSYKPIMFSAGLGCIYQNDEEIQKINPTYEDKIYQVGGLAYPIGMGGGSSSSSGQTTLDFSNAIQRGDPEMGSRVVSFLRNIYQSRLGIIKNIHDQGAGGPGNVLKEITEPLGGEIYIDKIPKGCEDMSVLESWCSEYQEQMAFLMNNNSVTNEYYLNHLSEKENVKCSLVGKIRSNNDNAVSNNNDKNDINVYRNNKKILNFNIDDVLTNIPQKTFKLKPYLGLDLNLNLKLISYIKNYKSEWKKFNDVLYKNGLYNIVENILKLPSVSSKSYLVNKVDRSVSGKISQQQCVGANQYPLSNYGCINVDLSSHKGAVTSVGEKPLIGFGSYKKMAEMTIGEMITNMIGIYIGDIEKIKCSANWMWSPKKNNGEEGYNMLKAVESLSECMCKLGIAIDGGKDSLSMHSNVDNKDFYSLPTLVLTGYSTVDNINIKTTPDLKSIYTRNKNDAINSTINSISNYVYHKSILLHIPFNKYYFGKLGGSCLLQIFNKLSLSTEENTPSIDDTNYFKKVFKVIQLLIKNGYIDALHDISDGGLLTTILEMSFGGNVGVNINIHSDLNMYEYLFSEELGVVIQINLDTFEKYARPIILANSVNYKILGFLNNKKNIQITFNDEKIIEKNILDLRHLWLETNYQLETFQSNINTILQEKEFNNNLKNYDYYLPQNVIEKLSEYKCDFDYEERKNICELLNVIVLRAPGSNGYREMEHILNLVGFNVHDFTISDLMKYIEEKQTLNYFKGIVFVGGFSYGDIPNSGVGWASILSENLEINNCLEEFRNRNDTFTLGVCNGCQVQSYLKFIDIEFKMRKNVSSRFESRWSLVKIKKSNSIFLKDLEETVFGIWSAHGEGKFEFNNDLNNNNYTEIREHTPINYVDFNYKSTEMYPFNPNGSTDGICAISSKNGRHFAIMPHPERCYLQWQIPYLQDYSIKFTPWFLFFKNAYEWCCKNN
jgi:phosphoribosylformylglycinamidine synthase